MSLIYFIPKVQCAPPLVQLAAMGLSYAFDAQPGGRETRKGPEDQVGCWIGHDSLLVRVGSDDLQSRRIPGTEAWVGRFQKDPPPKPVDLARKEQLDGHLVRLADGNDWLCPIARGWTEEDGEQRWYHALPQRLELDDDGKWSQGAVVAKFAPLWALATRWEEALVGAVGEDDETPVAFEFQDGIEAAIECLAVNYRIGPAECALLGLLTAECCRGVLHALIDWPTRLEWVQKKIQADAAGTSSSVGDAA